jgi:hypothetical protein
MEKIIQKRDKIEFYKPVNTNGLFTSFDNEHLVVVVVVIVIVEVVVTVVVDVLVVVVEVVLDVVLVVVVL